MLSKGLISLVLAALATTVAAFAPPSTSSVARHNNGNTNHLRPSVRPSILARADPSYVLNYSPCVYHISLSLLIHVSVGRLNFMTLQRLPTTLMSLASLSSCTSRVHVCSLDLMVVYVMRTLSIYKHLPIFCVNLVFGPFFFLSRSACIVLSHRFFLSLSRSILLPTPVGFLEPAVERALPGLRFRACTIAFAPFKTSRM